MDAAAREGEETMDTATYQLPTRDAAWAFMRACDAAGISAGFPSLTGEGAARTVQVGIGSCQQREAADALAAGAPVVDYTFGGVK